MRNIIKAGISVSGVKANPVPSLSTLRLIIIGYYSTSESSTLVCSSLDGSQNTENSVMFPEEMKGSFCVAQIRNKSKCWGSTAHFHCPHFLFKFPGKWEKRTVCFKPYKVCDRSTHTVVSVHQGYLAPKAHLAMSEYLFHCWIWRFYCHLMSRSQRFCKISSNTPNRHTQTITQAQQVNTSILYLRYLWEERVHILKKQNHLHNRHNEITLGKEPKVRPKVKRLPVEPAVVVHTWNPSTAKAETGE